MRNLSTLILAGFCVAALGACASSGRSAEPASSGPGVIDVGTLPQPSAATPVPASTPVPPVLLVPGIYGTVSDFDTMKQRLVADGWPADRLYTMQFAVPYFGCNVDNASQIQTKIDSILAETGASQVQIVAHSMGNLSSRYFLKELDGNPRVMTYLSLGGMHHGLASSCSPDFPGKPCTWTELCETGDFIAQLNAAPATPGNLWWVSFFGTADTTVPNASSMLDGAENVPFTGIDHDGLLTDPGVYGQVKAVLQRPKKN